MWKSVSVLLAVCGVFACIASITRAVDSITFPQNTTPWFEIKSAVLFNILCWMFVILAWYPATHGVSELLDDENIAQTWYVQTLFVYRLSLERRGLILYDFCKNHYPDYVTQVSIAWMR